MADLTHDKAVPEKGRLKGWHVLVWLGGFFGVMLIANGIFLYSALTSFPGEDVRKSYLQGLTYNETLELREAQAARGWQAEIGLTGLVGSEAVLARISDRAGSGLGALVVEGTLRRAATDAADRSLTFVHQGDGLYRAETGALMPGRWQVAVTARIDGSEEVALEARKSLMVEP